MFYVSSSESEAEPCTSQFDVLSHTRLLTPHAERMQRNPSAYWDLDPLRSHGQGLGGRMPDKWPWCDYPSGLIKKPIETGCDSCPTNSLHHRDLVYYAVYHPEKVLVPCSSVPFGQYFLKKPTVHPHRPLMDNSMIPGCLAVLQAQITGGLSYLTWDRFWWTRHERFVTVIQHCLCCLPHANPFFDFLKLLVSHHLGSSRVLSFSAISPTT